MGLYKVKKTWYISYGDGTGRQIRESSGCQCKADAQAVLNEKLRDVRMKKHPILREDKKIMFDKFADEFIDEYQGRHNELSESSRLNYQVLLKKLKEFFGHLSLEQISDDHIDQYIKERKQDTVKGRGGKKISKFTINRELGTLRLVLNWAKKKKKISSNPVAEKLSRENLFKEPPRTRYFSDDEISALIAAAKEPWKSFLLVGVNTGMRLSEIQGLRWDEIDTKNKSIILPPERTKGKKSREVRLNKSMVELFAKLKMQRQGSEFVFPNPDTAQPYSKCFSNSWKRLLKRSGINKPGHFHDLRRSFITKAGKAGANIKDIQVQVGHRDASTTLKVYLQATETGMQDVVDLVNFPGPAGEMVEMPKANAK